MMQTFIFIQLLHAPDWSAWKGKHWTRVNPNVFEHESKDGRCKERGRPTFNKKKAPERSTDGDMSRAEKKTLLLFLALFFGAVGFLLVLFCCGTEYWLLAVESCRRPEDRHGAGDGVRLFHQGLFWRCSFAVTSHEYSTWDLWISNQPSSKICQAAFLFPFPVHEPARTRADTHRLPEELFEHHSAIVFRTFWSIFLVSGVAAVVTGAFVLICACPLTNHKLFKVGGALQLCGGLCLLAVVLMYLMWVQVLDTLEQFALRRSLSSCPSFHLHVQHGPSFLLAPAAIFFCLLAGLLSVLAGRMIQRDETKEEIPERETSL
ncbi:transmembrane protein 182-like isoform X2 [Scophthalmus maximus]|uniref:transmembrane protein 182-like isoform X2 n=1 Tax=Scophthalmus maximus TaxID=52904 RepID=UPI0015E0860F|nr:transmembrane protein 182-like isoform X2 [Scophthalmus maximus]